MMRGFEIRECRVSLQSQAQCDLCDLFYVCSLPAWQYVLHRGAGSKSTVRQMKLCETKTFPEMRQEQVISEMP